MYSLAQLGLQLVEHLLVVSKHQQLVACGGVQRRAVAASAAKAGIGGSGSTRGAPNRLQPLKKQRGNRLGGLVVAWVPRGAITGTSQW